MLLFTQYKTIRGLPLSAVSYCHCLAALRAKMSVFNIHMHAGPPFIDFKYTHIAYQKAYSYNKNPESLCYKQEHVSVLICIQTTIEY